MLKIIVFPFFPHVLKEKSALLELNHLKVIPSLKISCFYTFRFFTLHYFRFSFLVRLRTSWVDFHVFYFKKYNICFFTTDCIECVYPWIKSRNLSVLLNGVLKIFPWETFLFFLTCSLNFFSLLGEESKIIKKYSKN